MSIEIMCRKLGMTQLYVESGEAVPCTVLAVDPNVVVQKKTSDGPDGYDAVQLAAVDKREKLATKPEKGHFAKAGVSPKRHVKESRLGADEVAELEVGQELGAEVFEEGQRVDVTGTSKGKGFQGGVKRHNFRMQDATHGNSISHRAPGSIGQCQTPGRVWKGKKMAGQMGNVKKTLQSLEVVKVDAENNLLLIKGAVPGATGSSVIVRPAIKSRG